MAGPSPIGVQSQHGLLVLHVSAIRLALADCKRHRIIAVDVVKLAACRAAVRAARRVRLKAPTLPAQIGRSPHRMCSISSPLPENFPPMLAPACGTVPPKRHTRVRVER